MPQADPHPLLRSLLARGVVIAFLIGAGVGLLALIASACSSTCSWGRPGATTSVPGGGYDESLAPDGTPLMRVRIARDEHVAEIGGPDRVTVRLDEPGSNERTFRTPLIVRLSARGWTVREGEGSSATLAGESVPAPPLLIQSDGSGGITLGDFELPGELRLQQGGQSDRKGLFDVVERVPIEEYLPGVLAKELVPGWSLEAYKAQAIAARSYALHERQRRLALGSSYDLESTTQDQAYAGTTASERAHKAVRATRGLVLTWHDTLLRAYYSSTTAGRAASARDTWPTGPGFEFNLAAPIQASPRDDADKFSPLFRWTVERKTDSLIRRLRAYGRDHHLGLRQIASLASIRAVDRNEFGRPKRYEITDTGAHAWTLSAESIRLACNLDVPGLQPITRKIRLNSGDFEARVEDQRVVFKGRGFGHGVGMSQYGAEGKARQGWTAERILHYYYPGAIIDRAY